MTKRVFITAKLDFEIGSQSWTSGKKYGITLNQRDVLLESDTGSETFTYINMDSVVNLDNFNVPRGFIM